MHTLTCTYNKNHHMGLYVYITWLSWGSCCDSSRDGGSILNGAMRQHETADSNTACIFHYTFLSFVFLYGIPGSDQMIAFFCPFFLTTFFDMKDGNPSRRHVVIVDDLIQSG